MSNHVHFIGVPENEDSVGQVFKYVNMKYSQYYNKKKGAYGHLFQGRFFSCVMDERHTIACARYVERNPVRAKIVKAPRDWKWSSARAHCGIDKHDELGVKKLFDYIDERHEDWEQILSEPDNAEEIKAIREQTRRGRPLGSSDFVEKLEKKLGRFLKLKPRGRPKSKGRK